MRGSAGVPLDVVSELVGMPPERTPITPGMKAAMHVPGIGMMEMAFQADGSFVGEFEGKRHTSAGDPNEGAAEMIGHCHAWSILSHLCGQRIGRKLRVSGLEFNVRDIGSNEPALVFLHYWGGTGRTWDLVARQLSERDRCIARDLRGWGGSNRKRGQLRSAQSGRVGNINVPTAVIVGDADKVETEPLLPRELARRNSGTEFIILPGVGHLSPLEAPSDLAAAITKAVSDIR